MNISRILVFWSFILCIVSCEVKPQEIIYGQDACHFCSMMIVDRQHAAEIVTVKGKAFKYDAIECMMNDLSKWDEPEAKYLLVADYTNPDKLVDATNSYFLISEAIPSPMGKFLTAFESAGERRKILQETNGESLNWKELKEEFNIQQ